MKSSGIYLITCVPTDKVYVGSSINCHTRIRDHKRLLGQQRHGNRHLQAAWNKYGEDNFTFTVIQAGTEAELKNLEQEWILKTKAAEAKFGFNCAYPVAQRTPSKRMHKAHKNYWANLTPEEKTKRLEHMRSPEFQVKATEGKIRNSEAISKSVKEIWQRPEAQSLKQKLRKRFASFKTNKAVLDKISLKAKERWKDPEYRERGLKQLAEANKKAAELKRAKSLSNNNGIT